MSSSSKNVARVAVGSADETGTVNSSLPLQSLVEEERPARPWTNVAIPLAGEFVGTFLFLFFAFAATQAGKASSISASDPALLLYICVSFGFALTVNVWIFYRVSGGIFNPAITLGLVAAGAMPPVKAAGLMVAQLLGGIAASAVVSGILPGSLQVGTNLSDGTSLAQGLFLEMFLTAELMLSIFLLAVEKHRATFLAPLGIGLAFFTTQLVGVFYTGGSLNPARSLGPAVVTGDFPKEHWIYWIGPILGALLGAGIYRLLLAAQYQYANPNQDSDGFNRGYYVYETGSNNGRDKRFSGVDSNV
ncbi:Aquaporin-1 [Rhizina undulata]